MMGFPSVTRSLDLSGTLTISIYHANRSRIIKLIDIICINLILGWMHNQGCIEKKYILNRFLSLLVDFQYRTDACPDLIDRGKQNVGDDFIEELFQGVYK